MNEYICIKILAEPEMQEIIIATVDDPSIEVYEETEEALLCFLPKESWTVKLQQHFENTLGDFNLSFEISEIPYTNWNETWESNFHPIEVGDFVGIRADFHPAFENVTFDLVINPKMAFGTGHHETTFQMIEMMRDIDFNDKQVLDYGCGTGILGILASKLGAKHVLGNDITEESIINTTENCKINGVKNFEVKLGTLDIFKGNVFDVILANINRNVLLDSASELYNMLNSDGFILLSGYMPEDLEIIESCFIKNGFCLIKHSVKGYWLCHKLAKQ